MDDRIAIEVVDCGQDSVLEFLFGRDADVTQHGARELGEEALYEIEPGAVLWGEEQGEAPFGLGGEPSLGFLGNVRRVIAEDELDRGCRRIGGVELLQEGDDLARSVSLPEPLIRYLVHQFLKSVHMRGIPGRSGGAYSLVW